MSPLFREIRTKLDLFHGTVQHLANHDKWPVVVEVYMRMVKLCEQGEILVSEEKESLVSFEKKALQDEFLRYQELCESLERTKLAVEKERLELKDRLAVVKGREEALGEQKVKLDQREETLK